MKLLGAHMSIEGGVHKALERRIHRHSDLKEHKDRIHVVSYGTGEWEPFSKTTSRNHAHSGPEEFHPRSVTLRLCRVTKKLRRDIRLTEKPTPLIE